MVSQPVGRHGNPSLGFTQLARGHKDYFILINLNYEKSMSNGIVLGLNIVLVSDLLLDHRNPRLPLEAISFDQYELCRLMEEDFQLEPIGTSLADNGYFQEEPLIGTLENGQIIIVEGNRRLAALKLLTQEKFRKRSENRDFWEELVKLVEEKGYDLTKVPVVMHKTREEVMSILGHRHISGPLRWEALPKARFINNFIQKQEEDINFYSIGRKIGYRQDSVLRNYVAYRVYLQAKEYGIDTSNVESYFGKFYTALNNAHIMNYLGLETWGKEPSELKKPIKMENMAKLKEIIEYIHGTEDVDAVFTDSRYIMELGEIVVNEESRRHLQATRDFQAALRLTGGEEEALINNLEEADILLRQSYRVLDIYIKNNTIRSLVDKCYSTIMRMRKVLEENINNK